MRNYQENSATNSQQANERKSLTNGLVEFRENHKSFKGTVLNEQDGRAGNKPGGSGSSSRAPVRAEEKLGGGALRGSDPIEEEALDISGPDDG